MKLPEAFPYFVCIGSQKAGTGWVYDQFCSHSDFTMPPVKEIHFFTSVFGPARQNNARKQLQKNALQLLGLQALNHNQRFLQAVIEGADLSIEKKLFWRDFDYYKSMFQLMGPMSGDITPSYMKLGENRVHQLAKHFPETRFFLIVRDPADRRWSHMQMHAYEKAKLQMLHSKATTDSQEFKNFARHKSVTALSFVSNTIKNFQKHMDGNRFKVFFFDDLKTQPTQFRTDIANFLDIDPQGFTLPANLNRKAAEPGKIAINNKQRTWLATHFAQEYDQLSELLGGHADNWKLNNQTYLIS